MPVALFFLLPGACLAFYGMALGPGSPAEPDSGLWPLLVGLGLFLCALGLPGRVSLHKLQGPGLGQALALTLICLFWLLLMESIGWLAATLTALCLAARATGNGWRYSLGMPPLFCLWLGQSARFLGWHLPSGWWS